MKVILPERRRFLGLATTLIPITSAAVNPDFGSCSLHVSLIDHLELLDISRAAVDASIACDVAGFWTPGDGGGGWFDWDPRANEPQDRFMVFEPRFPAPNGLGRWRRRLPHDGSVTFEMAGARGDGVTDDWKPANKVVQSLNWTGGGTIRLQPKGQYYLNGDLDLSAPNPRAPIILEGGGTPLAHGRDRNPVTFMGSRLIMEPTRKIVLGDGCILRRVVVWRHGTPEKPSSLTEIRRTVAGWFHEDGVHAARTIGILAQYGAIAIEEVAVIGYHTGIRIEGGDNRVERCYIDAGGYAIECTNIAGDCVVNAVNAGGAWSSHITATDELGDHAYRPGTAFYIHDRADGLQVTNCQANHWVNGMILSNVWLVTVTGFNAETSRNGGQPTYGIWTQNELRHVSIVDPRLVTQGTCIRFGHAVATSAVSLFGGSLEMDGSSGYCIQIDSGTSGQVYGTMTSNSASSALFIDADVIQWKIFGLQLWTSCYTPWAVIDRKSIHKVYLAATRAIDDANKHYMQSHINERMLIAYDSNNQTLDGSPRSPLAIDCLAQGVEAASALTLLRNGLEVGTFSTTQTGVALQAKELGFFGALPVARPVVTGSEHDGTAFPSLMRALSSLGLITNLTSKQ